VQPSPAPGRLWTSSVARQRCSIRLASRLNAQRVIVTCANQDLAYFEFMSMMNLAIAEEALSLSPAERADLAKLLIQSLEKDGKTDKEIQTELTRRFERLQLGEEQGLTFEQVFGAAPAATLRPHRACE